MRTHAEGVGYGAEMDRRTAPSAGMLVIGTVLLTVGPALVAFGFEVPFFVLLGGAAALGGLVALLVGVYRLASGVDRLVARVDAKDAAKRASIRTPLRLSDDYDED